MGREFALDQRLRDVVGRHPLEQVLLAVQEGQPARLRLLDDGDLDPVDHRQAPALEARQQRLALGVVGVGLRVVAQVAVAGEALHHDARAAPPLGQPERAGADRVLHDAVAVGLDHLARHRRQAGEGVEEARARLAQADAQRVAVDRGQALDRPVVVEGLLRLQRGLAQLAQADDALLLQRAVAGALGRRVVEALDRVDVVLGDQLAGAALEGRIVVEQDARAQLQREAAVIVGDLGQRQRGAGPDQEGPGQRVVVQRGLEDMRGDGQRVDIAELDRIEAGLGGREGVAQHLRRAAAAGAVRAGRGGVQPVRGAGQSGAGGGTGQQITSRQGHGSGSSKGIAADYRHPGRRAPVQARAASSWSRVAIATRRAASAKSSPRLA